MTKPTQRRGLGHLLIVRFRGRKRIQNNPQGALAEPCDPGLCDASAWR